MAKKNGVKENVKKTSEKEKLQELESGVNAEELEIASEDDIKKALTESISFTGTQKEITEKIDFAAFAICNHYDYDEKEGLYISPHGNFFIHNDVENKTRHVGIEELYDEYFMQKNINDLVKSFNNPTYGSSSDPELKYYYFEFDSKLLGLNKPYDLKIGVGKSENGIEQFYIEGYDRNTGIIYDNVEEELSEPYSKHFSFNNEYLKNEINEYLSRSFPEYDRVSIKIPDSIFEVKNVLSKEAFDNLKTRYDNETKNDKAQTAVFEVSLLSADKSDIHLYYDFRGKPNFLYGFENPTESNGNNYYSFTDPDNHNYKALLKKYPNLEEQVFNAINIDIKKQLCKFFTGMKNSQLTGEKQSFSETFETRKSDMFGKQYIENPSEVFNTLFDSSDLMMLENFNFGIFSPNHYDEIYPSSDGAEYRWTISDAATYAIIFGRAQSKEDVQIAINKQIGECSVELNKLDKINDMIIDSRVDNARNIILSKYMDSEVAAISRKDTERAINNYGLQEIIKNTLSNIKFNYEMSGSFVTTEFYDHGNKTLFCDYSFTDIEALIKGYDALIYGKESLSFQRPDVLQLKEAFENGDWEFDDILKGYAVFDGLNGEKVPEHICRIDDMMVFDSDNEAAQQWAIDNRSSLLVNGVDICIAGSDKQYLDFIDTPENRELLKDNLLDKPLADKFDFSGFSEEQFNKFKEELLSGKEVHDYKGTVKIGSVDIEIVHNEADGFIDTNLYVLGEDTGYSDEAIIPYSHYNGNQFAYQMITDNTYEEFKANFKAWFIHDLFELEMSDSETIAREVSRPNVDWKDFSQANELFRKKLEKKLLDKNIILPEEKFNWNEFSKEDFKSLKNDLKYNSYHDGHVYGSIHLGSISIDLTMRNKGEIDVDTYILGEEGVGGEIELDDAVIPYSEGILFTLAYAHIENLNFNDFKKWMQNYIVNEVLRSEDSKELLKEISRPTIDWNNKAECCELYSLKLGDKLNDVFNRNPLSMNIEDKNEALKLIDMGANAKEVLLNAAADANIFENCHWFMQNIPENDLKEYFSDKEFAQQMFNKAKDFVTLDEGSWEAASDIGYDGFKEIAQYCGRINEAEKYYQELLLKHGYDKPVYGFADDIDKMWDFANISKDDFLMSYSYVSEEEYDATAAELKNKNLSAFQVVENLLEKGEKFSAEEAEMSYIADKIVQQAYESSASGFNYYIGFDEIANLIGKDVQWITDHLDELAEELETHNDELLLDFNGEDNIDFKEEEIDFNFCSVGEDANILFKKCDDGRWIRKTDEELQRELNEEDEERFVNVNISQTAEVSVTDTDYEVISNIADQNVISELNSNPVSSDSARLYLALKKNITEMIESHPKDFLQGNLNPETFNWKDDINWNSFESVSRLWDYLGKHESNCKIFTNELFKSVYFEKENQVKRDFLSCIENVTVEDIYKNKDRTELDSVRFTMRISKDFAFLKQGMSYWASDSSELDEHSVYITATVSKDNKTSTPDWKFEFTDSVGETASVVSLNDYFQDSFIIPFTSAIKANCEKEYKHVHGNIDIQHAVNSNVPVARAYSTDTNDVEAFSLILDELLSKQQFTTGSIAVDKSELLDDIRNSASDILEYCEYNNIQFYFGTDSKLYCLDISEDYNGEPIECNTLYDVFSEAKDSADAAEYYQYDVYTPESFERIETVFNTLEMLKENQKIEIQVPGITQEDIDICAGYDIDFSKKENQQTLSELKNIFINTLDKFPDTSVSDLENAVYHCTEESRWSDLGKLLAQDSDNSIRFMFAENMIKHVTSESQDENLSPKTAAEKGIEDIIKEEVNLDPVSMAGEKFIFELQKNITSYKNNPWVTTKIILDELKKDDPEEYKNVSLFFKKKNLKSKADYENFFEQSIGSRKVCSISTEKKEPEISKNKPGKEDPDYTR